VRFVHAARGTGVGIELRSIDEDVAKRDVLWTTIDALVAGPVRRLEFVVGAASTYTEEERARYSRLPARLFNDVEPESAAAIAARLEAAGLDVARIGTDHVRRHGRRTLGVAALSTAVAVVAGVLSAGSAPVLATAIGVGLVATLLVATRWTSAISDKYRTAMYRLREAPAALSASDPLVGRLAALLDAGVDPDLRSLLGELALLVQQVVDRRASLAGAERRELEVLTAPFEPLVGQLEVHARRVVELDRLLADLDEAKLLRELGQAQARGEEVRVDAVLTRLDTLRALEDERAAVVHRLLAAAGLLRRAADLGLAVTDADAEHERQILLALAALDE
jgi:hypothetical protein